MASVCITKGQRTCILHPRTGFSLDEVWESDWEAGSQRPLLEGLPWSPRCVCHLGALPPFSWVQGSISCPAGRSQGHSRETYSPITLSP